MNFDQAFEAVLGHEGGFSDHPDDPGGATRYGVTEAIARAAGYTGSMRDFPLTEAKRIYRDRYWNVIQGDLLPAGLRYVVFDAAINSGPSQAAKWLQRALGVKEDGVIGPKTLTAAGSANADVVLRRMLSYRLRFMTNLYNWTLFSRGWVRRISDLLDT